MGRLLSKDDQASLKGRSSFKGLRGFPQEMGRLLSRDGQSSLKEQGGFPE